jgi:hypothetical protein
VEWHDHDVELLERDGQARLWWDGIPVDLFLDTTDFHRGLSVRAHREEFAGRQLSFLSCTDLAVFEAFFARSRDLADLEEMAAVGSLNVDRAVGVLVRYLVPDDEPVARLLSLASPGSRATP